VADFDRVVGGLPSRRRPVVVGSCLFHCDLHGLCVRRDLLLFLQLRRFHCFLVSTGTDVWIIEVEIETEWPMLLLVEQQEAQLMLETGSGRY